MAFALCPTLACERASQMALASGQETQKCLEGEGQQRPATSCLVPAASAEAGVSPRPYSICSVPPGCLVAVMESTPFLPQDSVLKDLITTV